MGNLFSGTGEKPLSVLITPQDLDEFSGQAPLVGQAGPLRKLIEQDKMVSAVFYGPPGCGKTALARIIAHRTHSEFIRLNAVTARVDDLRTALKRARHNLLSGTKTLLFIDEIHRFNKMVQDGLLPALEEGEVIMIGTTTKNPFFSLIPPLRSRIHLFEFERLSEDDLASIMGRIKTKTGARVNPDAEHYMIRFANGDARRMCNIFETARNIAGKQPIDLAVLKGLISRQQLLYDRDEDYHYDVISAYIKSIRGSDPDSALYYLAHMLESGEDPLYIARRLVILASEDIGLADSFSLVLAVSAFDGVNNIGMPEARIVLSHVTIYLALQPKSNSAYTAITKAAEYTRSQQVEIPDYLRSAHPAAKYYKYPHNYPLHYVVQEYVRKKVHFFEPGDLGEEKELKKRIDFLRGLKEED